MQQRLDYLAPDFKAFLDNKQSRALRLLAVAGAAMAAAYVLSPQMSESLRWGVCGFLSGAFLIIALALTTYRDKAAAMQRFAGHDTPEQKRKMSAYITSAVLLATGLSVITRVLPDAESVEHFLGGASLGIFLTGVSYYWPLIRAVRAHHKKQTIGK